MEPPGCKKFCFARYNFAVITNVIVSYIILGIILLIINANPFQPFSSVLRSFGKVLSWYSLFMIVPLVGLIFLNGFFLTCLYLAPKDENRSRFDKCTRKLMRFGVTLITGCFFTWTYLHFLPPIFADWTVSVEEDEQWNMRRVFLELSGAYASVYYFMTNWDLYLVFPIVNQPKKLRIKDAVISELLAVFWKSFLPNLAACAFISTVFGIVGHKANVVEFLFDFKLIFYTWILFAYINGSLDLMRQIFDITMSDYEKFPLEKSAVPVQQGGVTEVTLAEALATSKIPLVQYLAARDLFELSVECNKSRRVQLYALSTIGGHPHNWRRTSCAALFHLRKFTNDVKAAMEPEQTLTSTLLNNNHNPQKQMPMTPIFAPAVTSPIANKTFNRDLNESLGIRSLIIATPDPNTTFVSEKEPTPQRRSSVVDLIFHESNTRKVNKLLDEEFQKIIWLSRGLTTLTVHSITEDKHGSVKVSLPKIIKQLVDLYEVVEKISAKGLIAKKGSQNYVALKSALKMSLYRMAKVFEKYLDEMIIDPHSYDVLRGIASN